MPKEKYEPNIAIHPGKTLQGIIEYTGMTQKELATRTSLSPKTINEISTFCFTSPHFRISKGSSTRSSNTDRVSIYGRTMESFISFTSIITIIITATVSAKTCFLYMLILLPVWKALERCWLTASYSTF